MKDVEMRRYTEDELEIKPKLFDNKENGYAELTMVDSYAFLCPEYEKTPIVYFRHGNVDSFRFAGFVRLGEGPLSTQTSAHHDDVAGADAKAIPYHKISDDPASFGFGSKEPFSDFVYTEKGATWKEADILDVEVEPFPYTLIVHKTDAMSYSPWINQPCVIKGTYEGKPIKALGAYDKVFTANTSKEMFKNGSFAYVSTQLLGIREDGRREAAFMNMSLGENAPCLAYYWLEGEEPIVADKAEFLTEWIHLPYVNDGTCSYKDFVLKIGPKTIHFTGKWGSKGFTKEARIDKHGQSQSFGTFYEGDTPYNHSTIFSFNENMDVFDYRLKETGFKVID